MWKNPLKTVRKEIKMEKQEEERMAKEVKTIGVLTSGGDAPVMNAGRSVP